MRGKLKRLTGGSAQAASIGLELSVDACRAVALGPGPQPRLLGWAESNVDSEEQLGATALDVLERLGCRAPVRLLMLGANARYFNVELPRMSGAESRRALLHRIDEQLEDNAAEFLIAHRARKLAGGGQNFAVIALPREPLETIAAMLESAGHEVAGCVVPTTLVGGDLGASEDGCLWVDIGGTRTIVTLSQRDRVVLSREIPPRQEYAEDDEMAQFERQMAEYQEVERSVLYFRQNVDNKGPNRVVLTAAESELESFLGQFRDPLVALDIRVEGRPAWEGVDFDREESAIPRRRLALAVRTARSAGALAAIPEVCVQRRTTRRKRAAIAGATAFAACLISILAVTSLVDLQSTRDRLAAGQEGLSEMPAHIDSPTAAALTFDVVPEPVAVWSGVLAEVGLMAIEGVEYERVLLETSGGEPTLSLEGQVSGREAEEIGERLAELLRTAESSAYVRGLPRLVAAGRVDGAGGDVRFTIELPVQAAAGERR